MFIVKKAINGISINGDEYLLKDDGSLWRFQSKGQAKRALIQHNIDLDSVEIVIENEEKGKYSDYNRRSYK